MPGTATDDIFHRAVQLHSAGQISQAEVLYRQILAQDPRHAQATNLLGVIAIQVQKYDAAIQLIERAIAQEPGIAEFRNNLGNALRGLGRFADSILAYDAAIRINPAIAAIHVNLAATLQQTGDLQRAAGELRTAMRLKPDSAHDHRLLADILKQLGELDQAAAAYRAATDLEPGDSSTHNELGNVLQGLGRFEEAVAAYKAALAIKPTYPEAYANLGNALRFLGRLDESIEALNVALKFNPELSGAHNNLGNVYRDQGQLEEAAASFQTAARLNPQSATAFNNLASVQKDQGYLEDAVKSFRKAVDLEPGFQAAYSNLLYTLQFCPELDEQSIAREHALWNQRHAQPLSRQIQPHSNDRSPDRPLRIGYLGADFKDHCQSCFTLPLLAHHDHSRFVIHCYSNVSRPDAVTQAHQNLADQWRSIFGIPDGQVAQMIRSDQIDILIDLSLHMADNRLLVLAHKPAPIQVSWLGYPASTGLETIDYRLSDPYLDPADQHQNLYPDQVLRLPHSFWCYAPLDGEQPPVNPLPALQNGQLTFGCLNNFCKINPGVLQLWSRLLEEIPNSRLMVLSDPGSHRLRMIQTMVGFGLSDPSRVSFVSKRPRLQYLGLYHQIDLALDSFPYNGHTTSLDGLWMGVPLISLVGTRPVGRGGLSLLSNLGLQELAAQSQQRYIDLARELSGDLPRLAELRSGMRERMKASPLMDAAAFARGMEEALAKMWREWCTDPGS